MKDIFITQLRDHKTDRAGFRQAANALTHLLAQEAAAHIKTKKITVKTPLTQTEGAELESTVILAPILRSGITMIPAFLTYFPSAKIAVVGMQRDEETAIAEQYYSNIPSLLESDTVVMLDPMLATGGTASATIELLVDRGANEKNIIFVSIISAPEGVERMRSLFPNLKLIIGVEDDHLNDEKFIVPGIGDYGDRFFGTK